jgi:hypothetical protein
MERSWSETGQQLRCPLDLEEPPIPFAPVPPGATSSTTMYAASSEDSAPGARRSVVDLPESRPQDSERFVCSLAVAPIAMPHSSQSALPSVETLPPLASRPAPPSGLLPKHFIWYLWQLAGPPLSDISTMSEWALMLTLVIEPHSGALLANACVCAALSLAQAVSSATVAVQLAGGALQAGLGALIKQLSLLCEQVICSSASVVVDETRAAAAALKNPVR